MPSNVTIEQAVQDFLKARAARPQLTPEEHCAASPHAPAGLLQVLLSLSSSIDGSNTYTRTSTDGSGAAARPPAPAGPPEKLGVYAIEKQLGEGGMGTVYLAMDTRLDRPVAIKVMRPEIAMQPLARARFLREAKAMAAVRHEHVAAIHAANEEPDGTTWLAMELLEGETLDDAVKRGERFDWKTVMRLGREIALGLHAAHAKRLIHRDIKPANIWLEAPGAKVKLLDFGLARQEEGGSEVTGTGATLGTPAYMAPEQAKGDAVDHRCDLFSLGVLLYRLTTGRLPFVGTSAMATLMAMATEEPPPVKTLRPDCPDGLADLIRRLLSKKREGRPPTSKAVADELLDLDRNGDRTQVMPPMPVPEAMAADPWDLIGADDAGSPAITAGRSGVRKGASAAKSGVRKSPLTPPATPATLAAAPKAAPQRYAAKSPRKARLAWWMIAAPVALTLALVVGGIAIFKKGGKDSPSTEPKDAGTPKTEVVAGPVRPAPVTPKTVPAGERVDYAAERKAAEKLLKNKAFFTLHSPAGEPFGDSKSLPDNKLPKSSFSVETALLPEDAADDTLAALAACQRLAKLEVQSKAVTDAGFKEFRGFPRLQSLILADCPVGDAAVEFLKQCPALDELSLRGTNVTDAGLQALAGCPALRKLELPAAATAAGFAPVVQACRELRDVAVQPCDRALVAPLAGLPRLRQVHCGDHQLDAEGVAVLEKKTHLLALKLTSPSAAGLGRLSPLAGRLRSLTLRHLPPGRGEPATWEPLFQLAGLEEINFENSTDVDDAALAKLAKMPRLRRLDLSALDAASRKHTSEGVAAFRQLRPDVSLRVTTEDGLQDFPAVTNWPGRDQDIVGSAPWALPKDAPPPAVTPFSAVKAKKSQEAWAKFVGQPVEVENKIGMKFRLIPPGEYETALPAGNSESAGGPAVVLRVTRPFHIGRTEVTVAQFRQFADATGYKTETERGLTLEAVADRTWKNPGYASQSEFPVTMLTPADCQAFCDWLGGQDKAVYRLPTEAEWELAARGGGVGPWALGKTPEELEARAWLNSNSGGLPHPVAVKKANTFGLFDVVGNVWEMCLGSGRERMASAVDPVDGERVLRGVAYDAGVPHGVQAAFRTAGNQTWGHVGFRVLRQTTDDPLAIVVPGKLAGKPVMVAAGRPLAAQAAVSRPAPVAGVRSWSVELAAHQGGVGTVAWSPAGDRIATIVLDDPAIRLWDRQGNLKAVLLGHQGGVKCAAFSADGTKLASGEGRYGPDMAGEVRIWDVPTGKCLAVVPQRSWVADVAFSPSGKALAVCGAGGLAQILDLETGATRPLVIEGGGVRLSWAPDGKRLAVAMDHAKVSVWTAATGELVGDLKLPDKPLVGQRVAYSPSGDRIATGGDKVRVWDAGTLKLAKEYELPAVTHLAWHKAGQLLALRSNGDRNVIIDARDGKTAATLHGGYENVSWAPDGAELAGMAEGVLAFIDPATGRLKRQGPEAGKGNAHQAHVTADGKTVFWKHDLPTVSREFDADTGALRREPDHPERFLRAVAPNGRWLAFAATAVDPGLAFAGPAGGPPARLDPPGLPTWNWRADPTGARLAGAYGQELVVYDTATRKKLYAIDHPEPLGAEWWSSTAEWSPDGKRLATVAGKTVRVWNADGGKLLRAFDAFPQPPAGHGGPALAWDPDSRGLWVTFGLSVARLDTETGRVAPPENFSNGQNVWGVFPAPDGERLYAFEGYGWAYLKDWDGTRRLLGQHLPLRPTWHPDGRRLVGSTPYGVQGVRAFDAKLSRRLGTLWPMMTGNHWICIGPDGHYRGSKDVESQIVCVAMLDDGSQQTLTPEEFAKKFDWKNDPAKARLMKLDP